MSTTEHTNADQLREQVRDRYATAARQATSGTQASDCGCGQPADCGCATSCCGPADAPTFGGGLYSLGEREVLPETALLASLGCGNPTAVADLRTGETVLDLGSGGGIDVLLSARRVGPTGRAYGLDMTEEMLALARRNAAEAGVTNVDFLKGHIERIPLPAATVDLIISNCVINLSVDKPAVFAEMRRVLAPGGRIGISDVVAEDRLSPGERAERGNWVGCIAGALSMGEYRRGLAAAGFEGISISPTHQVADGLHSAIIKAVKASEPTRAIPGHGREELQPATPSTLDRWEQAVAQPGVLCRDVIRNVSQTEVGDTDA
jgi:arsenite methyltransferase